MSKNAWMVGAMCIAAALGVSPAAWAGTIVFSDTFTMATTNWNGFLHITKFDPGLGTLTGINFLLEGEILGNVRFESFDAEPTTVATYLQAEITLSRPDLSTIVATTPTAANSDDASAFDGLIDFGGTSGKTYPGLTASASTTVDSPPPAGDFALFTGPGAIALPISAAGLSYADGAGNLITWFNTQAEATATVTYTFREAPPVPEPSSLALLLAGAGVLALGGATRRVRR